MYHNKCCSAFKAVISIIHVDSIVMKHAHIDRMQLNNAQFLTQHFMKWKKEFDKECCMFSWLDCDVEGKSVTKLKCLVCTKFETRIVRWRNFSNKWIVGADSIPTSSIKDYAITDQHNHAMTLLTKEQPQSHLQGPSSYAPIVKALQQIPDDRFAKLQRNLT